MDILFGEKWFAIEMLEISQSSWFHLRCTQFCEFPFSNVLLLVLVLVLVLLLLLLLVLLPLTLPLTLLRLLPLRSFPLPQVLTC